MARRRARPPASSMPAGHARPWSRVLRGSVGPAAALLIALVSTAPGARAGESPEASGEPRSWRLRRGLELVLWRQCRTHAGRLRPAALRCSRHALALARRLDFRAIDADAVAAFSRDLVTLARDPATSAFIDELLRAVDGAAPERPVLLWVEALRASRDDAELALRRLAVLLQDTAHLTHLDYLRRVLGPSETVESLARLAWSLEANPNVRLLPPEVAHLEASADSPFPERRAPYHFYVTAWLARRLSAREPSRPERAAALPSLFQASYEVAQYCSEGLGRDIHECLRDPPPPPHPEALRDLHRGRLGALWGAGAEPGRLEHFEAFAARWSANPRARLREWLASLR